MHPSFIQNQPFYDASWVRKSSKSSCRIAKEEEGLVWQRFLELIGWIYWSCYVSKAKLFQLATWLSFAGSKINRNFWERISKTPALKNLNKKCCLHKWNAMYQSKLFFNSSNLHTVYNPYHATSYIILGNRKTRQ